MNPELDPKPESSQSFVTKFWNELKRRKVIRVATVYAVVAWIVIQVAVATFPSLLIPEWALRLVIMCVLLGFPISLIIAWAFELTPDGIKTTRNARENSDGSPVPDTHERKRGWFTILIAAAAPTVIFGALALFFFLRADRVAAEPTGSSVAVLPLINMSPDPDNQYFADGVHEDILTNLTRLDKLKVSSRTTMLSYALSDKTLAEIGKELGVDYVVEGSVRRIGNHVRVTIQLIDARNDHHLWANNFERELVDVFATQSELSKEISNSLHLEIQPETIGQLDGLMTHSVEAYDLYIKAASLEKSEGETEENMLRCFEMLERAVEIDPGFVEAWAALKMLSARMAMRVHYRGWFLGDGINRVDMQKIYQDKSKRAMAKAMTLDPENPETLLASVVDHVWPQPEAVLGERKKILDRLIRENPENAKAQYHLVWWHIKTSEADEAKHLAAVKRFDDVLAKDPFNTRLVMGMLELYRRYDIQDEQTEFLVNRLKEILPHSRETMRLVDGMPERIIRRLEDQFAASGDESLIGEIESMRTERRDDFITTPHYLYRALSLCSMNNSEDDAIALADDFETLESSYFNEGAIYLTLHSNAMSILWNNGDAERAKEYARKIVTEMDNPIFEPRIETSARLLAHIASAYKIIGDDDIAQEYYTKSLGVELVGNFRGRYLANVLGQVAIDDVDNAVDIAFQTKENDPEWNGFDWIAIRQLYHRPLVEHPRVVEYFVQEGKWIDYLSERVPAYAKYAEDK